MAPSVPPDPTNPSDSPRRGGYRNKVKGALRRQSLKDLPPEERARREERLAARSSRAQKKERLASSEERNKTRGRLRNLSPEQKAEFLKKRQEKMQNKTGVRTRATRIAKDGAEGAARGKRPVREAGFKRERLAKAGEQGRKNRPAFGAARKRTEAQSSRPARRAGSNVPAGSRRKAGTGLNQRSQRRNSAPGRLGARRRRAV